MSDWLDPVYDSKHSAYVQGYANGKAEAMKIAYHLALSVSYRHSGNGDEVAARAAEDVATLLNDLNSRMIPSLGLIPKARTYPPKQEVSPTEGEHAST